MKGVLAQKRKTDKKILCEKYRLSIIIDLRTEIEQNEMPDLSCRENLGKAARCVMEHDFSKGCVLWHCTEGKDRCGLLSAVLLLALGVERSTIMEDIERFQSSVL